VSGSEGGRRRNRILFNRRGRREKDAENAKGMKTMKRTWKEFWRH
jgi:hypothetical protein